MLAEHALNMEVRVSGHPERLDPSLGQVGAYLVVLLQLASVVGQSRGHGGDQVLGDLPQAIRYGYHGRAALLVCSAMRGEVPEPPKIVGAEFGGIARQGSSAAESPLCALLESASGLAVCTLGEASTQEFDRVGDENEGRHFHWPRALDFPVLQASSSTFKEMPNHTGRVQSLGSQSRQLRFVKRLHDELPGVFWPHHLVGLQPADHRVTLPVVSEWVLMVTDCVGDAALGRRHRASCVGQSCGQARRRRLRPCRVARRPRRVRPAARW